MLDLAKAFFSLCLKREVLCQSLEVLRERESKESFQAVGEVGIVLSVLTYIFPTPPKYSLLYQISTFLRRFPR